MVWWALLNMVSLWKKEKSKQTQTQKEDVMNSHQDNVCKSEGLSNVFIKQRIPKPASKPLEATKRQQQQQQQQKGK